jgi:hypothetical protein
VIGHIWSGVGWVEKRCRGVCLKMMEILAGVDQKRRKTPEERREREGSSYVWILSKMSKIGVQGILTELFGEYTALGSYPDEGERMDLETTGESLSSVYETSTRLFQKGLFINPIAPSQVKISSFK